LKVGEFVLDVNQRRLRAAMFNDFMCSTPIMKLGSDEREKESTLLG
jgi:hypothetical protein